MPTYKPGETACCPHCGKPMDGPVEDHVVQGWHGKVDHPYQNDCGWCDKLFDVTKLQSGDYLVTARTGSV